MVRLLQLLCRQRHCLIAMPIPEAVTVEEACEVMRKEIGPGGRIAEHCAICGSKDLFFEIGSTRWRTVEEAMPTLLEHQNSNLVARQKLDLSGATFDSQRLRGLN